MNIVVLGAGSIGCYVAGCLLTLGTTFCASNTLTLIGRQRLQDDISKNGISVTDWQGRNQVVDVENISFSLCNDSLGSADVILLCVKSQDTEQAADIIKLRAKSSAVVISLQNGVSNAHALRKHLKQTVIAGMVPFNVFYKGHGHFHCGTEGNIALEDPDNRCVDLIEVLENASLPVTVYNDMTGVQYGKLIMNLNPGNQSVMGK